MYSVPFTEERVRLRTHTLETTTCTAMKAEQLLNHTAESSTNQSFSTRRQFLELPKSERHRILSEQAEEMADFYENDTEWREWERLSLVEYDIPVD